MYLGIFVLPTNAPQVKEVKKVIITILLATWPMHFFGCYGVRWPQAQPCLQMGLWYFFIFIKFPSQISSNMNENINKLNEYIFFLSKNWMDVHNMATLQPL
jgi:hypothetical protein